MVSKRWCPAHYANIVRNCLNDNLSGRWIGRRGSIELPARSPDLTPLDFSLWGYLKHKVYGNHIISVQQLKQLIKDEIELLNLDKTLLKRVCNSVTHRIQQCNNADGGHFEN